MIVMERSIIALITDTLGGRYNLLHQLFGLNSIYHSKTILITVFVVCTKISAINIL